jgi:hypothetical protein
VPLSSMQCWSLEPTRPQHRIRARYTTGRPDRPRENFLYSFFKWRSPRERRARLTGALSSCRLPRALLARREGVQQYVQQPTGRRPGLNDRQRPVVSVSASSWLNRCQFASRGSAGSDRLASIRLATHGELTSLTGGGVALPGGSEASSSQDHHEMVGLRFTGAQPSGRVAAQDMVVMLGQLAGVDAARVDTEVGGDCGSCVGPGSLASVAPQLGQRLSEVSAARRQR